jgi:hypothetical protein
MFHQEDHHMPVRTIPKNYRNVTGVAAARKSLGEAAFESMLERDFLTLLDFDPAIQSFEVQPEVIPWTDLTGKRRDYTPDCLARFEDERMKPILFEVKYREKLWKDWSEMRPKYREAIHHTAKTNRRFRIVTEKEIYTQYFESARFLLPIIRRGIESPEMAAQLVAAIAKLRQTTPNRLLANLSRNQIEQARFLPTLWGLIGTFKIGADLWQPLNMESKIWSP